MLKIISLLIVIITFSCTPKIHGPNYNVGVSHNKSNFLRHSVVKKEDLRMKNAMIKHRRKYSREIKRTRKVQNKPNKRLIR